MSTDKSKEHTGMLEIMEVMQYGLTEQQFINIIRIYTYINARAKRRKPPKHISFSPKSIRYPGMYSPKPFEDFKGDIFSFFLKNVKELIT